MRRTPSPPPIYAIADAAALAPRTLGEAVEEMAAAGVRWIQVRGKRMEDGELFRQLEDCVRRAARHGVDLWIDDRADLAALLPVAGVHLGQRDLPPAAARRVVGDGVWIGRSTHGDDQLREAAEDPEVDVIAVGPVFPTTGKRDPDPVVGTEILERWRGRTRQPLVAIGGIGERNLGRVLASGADAVAMIGAVCRGAVGDNCRRLVRAAEAGR